MGIANYSEEDESARVSRDGKALSHTNADGEQKVPYSEHRMLLPSDCAHAVPEALVIFVVART